MITAQTQSADVLHDIVVADPKMRQVIEFARKVAPLKAAVLITGETGSGKELIARLIHQHSNRRAKPWVDVNCAALPEHLVESELFGYEKGAFSGADSAKPGLFEIANGGTLFLDEIGELESKVQVKLLRVLDNVPYYRLGGNRKVFGGCQSIGGHQSRLAGGGADGRLPPRSLPPYYRGPGAGPSFARTAPGHCGPGDSFSATVLSRERGSLRRRWSCCHTVSGGATFANCTISS